MNQTGLVVDASVTLVTSSRRENKKAKIREEEEEVKFYEGEKEPRERI